MSENTSRRPRLAILASGTGTNAEAIIRYFAERPTCEVAVVMYSRPTAAVRQRAEALGVPTELLDKATLADEARTNALMDRYQVDVVVLAGFLLLVPGYLVRRFPDRIINIHPALMPKHCGHGMFGHHVHEAVLASGDQESGITIHVVDELYDHGPTLCQKTCPVLPFDTPDDLQARVHELEIAWFAPTIERHSLQILAQ